jgi:hypothetical protein
MSVHQVLAARRFRVVFGTSLLLTGVAALAAIASFDLHAVTLAAPWLVSVLLAFAASHLPGIVARPASGPEAPVGPFAALRLDRGERDRARELARASLTMPLVALAFVAPLSIHAVVASLSTSGRDYSTWIAISVVIVPHAHIVLAIFAARFARQLIEGRNARAPAVEGLIGVGFSTLAAAIPGIVLIGVPPALTLLTGISFVPLAFWLLSRSFAREEVALRETS